jgi:signal transduction histidine kinase
MLRRTMIGVLALCAFAVSAVVYAQTAEFGTAEEARALLDRAVTSMKADPANTIAQINKGEGGFKDRDLYVFCYADGKVVAHGNDPTRVGMLTKDLKDTAGKLYGEEMLRVAEEGKVAEVSYMFPRPGSDTTPVPKVALVTKVTDHVCAVGYYTQN